MAADFAAMVKAASEKVGAETAALKTPSGESTLESSGIVIESQNAEHIRGQAKSGEPA